MISLLHGCVICWCSCRCSAKRGTSERRGKYQTSTHELAPENAIEEWFHKHLLLRRMNKFYVRPILPVNGSTPRTARLCRGSPGDGGRPTVLHHFQFAV